VPNGDARFRNNRYLLDGSRGGIRLAAAANASPTICKAKLKSVVKPRSEVFPKSLEGQNKKPAISFAGLSDYLHEFCN